MRWWGILHSKRSDFANGATDLEVKNKLKAVDEFGQIMNHQSHYWN